MSVAPSTLCADSTQNLYEEDIPGASPADKDPKTLKVVNLQHWLQCRDMSTKGKKADLVLW